MADDLDDEWWLQENNGTDKEASKDVASESEVESADEAIPNKRKAESDNDTSLTDEPPKKKKKKKKKLNITEVLKKNAPQAGCPGDVVTEITKHFKDKLSPIEEDEIQLSDPDEHFLESNTLDQLPTSYFNAIMPKWKKQIQKLDVPGAPILLVISSAAIRALEVKRQMKTFLGEKSKTAKLFAKHMKIKEQEKHLGKNVIHCGIGTPNRIRSLLDSGALKTNRLHYIVFDWNWRDQKQKRLIDGQDVKTDLMQLLQKHLIPLVKAGNAKFGLL
ncbi:protein CMSS1-like [Lineus longissimus]|uniref:protein CMSS1-like n=1 Tax=Lineus longissimus TaxID=88925 RepID=UPI002B4CB59C